MPQRISMTPYALRINDTSSGTRRQLDNLPGNTNLIDLLINYLTLREQERSINNTTQHVLKVDHHQRNGQHSIDGILKTGAYGFSSDIEHLDTGRMFIRTVDDCEYLPFFFSVVTRPGQNEAILLLQRFGVYGTKSILYGDLAAYIAQNLPDSALSINPIVSDEYIEHVIGGQIKSLTCIRFNVPTDVADDLGIEDHQEDNATMEVEIKAKRDRFLSIPKWMRDTVNGWQTHRQMIEVSGVEYDDVKLQVDVGGKIKTIKLSDLRKVRMILDVTSDVQINADGHPTIDSLRSVVSNLMQNFWTAIGWGDDH